MSKIRATITAVGHYVPEKVLSNADFEKMVDTTDEWIRTRTGISERRIMEHGGCSDMAVPAVQLMLARRGIQADEIDLIICSTITPDMFFPSTACLIQDRLGLPTSGQERMGIRLVSCLLWVSLRIGHRCPDD